MDKNKLIKLLIAEKGGTREQYLSLLNKIAYHESAHTMDPTIKQKGGGPGRGKYQFEEGKNRGAITAARRTKQYLQKKGLEVPQWLSEATQGDSLDATQLNGDQQDILFLGNMRMHPKADIGKVVNDEQSVTDFWLKYHWAGNEEDKYDRKKAFATSLEDFKKKNPQPEQQSKDYSYEQEVVNLAVKDNIPNIEAQMLPKAKELASMPQQQSQPQQQDQGLFSYLQNKNEQPFNEINEGGSHETNPMGGVPHGTGDNGKMNRVEENESTYDFGHDNKYVFSDRVSLTDYISNKKFNTNQFAMGGKLTDPVDPPQEKKPPVTPDQSLNNAVDLYMPVMDKVMQAFGTKDYNMNNLKGVTPLVKNGLEKAFGFTMDDFESGKRTVPKLDDDMKELQNIILETPDKELKELLSQDYSDINMLNFKSKLPEGVSVWQAIKYYRKFNQLKEQGYTFKNGGFLNK